MRYAAILAGGSGTRLWPMSRAEQPKQLIPFIENRSLLEVAVDRLDGLVDPDRRLIATGERYRAAIRRAMPGLSDAQILGEPEGRDTLAAVGLPAAVALKEDPEAVIAVFTADHLIKPIDVFQECVERGFRLAESGAADLVTFGIQPTHPATGYGYVEMAAPIEGFGEAFATARFVEKPDEATARRYVASGSYAWNSGMFVWRAATLLGCIERYHPQVHEGLTKIADAWGTDAQQATLGEIYPTLEKISVDFAVMEPASTDDRVAVATVPMPVEWLDVGGWPAYGRTLDADADGNRRSTDRTLMIESRESLVVSDDPNHLIATIGVDDLVIVHTEKATLICRRDRTEQIKQLQQAVKDRFGSDYV